MELSAARVKGFAATFLVLAAGLFSLAGCDMPSSGDSLGVASTARVEVILSELENPRGVAVGPAGEMFVAEAGTGYAAVDPSRMTGKLTRFADRNSDGDFDDEGEAERWFSHLPTYNALQFFKTHRDEVNGPGDVLLHPDGRLFLSVDGGFDDLALFEISPEGRVGRNLANRSNMNGIAFNLRQDSIYAVESMANGLIEVTLKGDLREIVAFPLLDSGQQAVPAGLAVDHQTGEILIALFSGAAVDKEAREVIPFVPGDAKVVRVDPETGQIADEITGLTTAVDVAVDDPGNVYVVEMAAAYADPLPVKFDLFDPDAPPLAGGYQRFSGRVTLYPAGGGPLRVLAGGLDMPTNITLGPDGALYVSTGQGTPGRPIPGPDGPTKIVGEILRITGFLSRD
ncbi:MAG: ScyD/ScyE family protein [Anaerolineae bacterium]